MLEIALFVSDSIKIALATFWGRSNNSSRQAAMKEAMRLHPGVGFPLERFVPDGGATICGVHLPAGTNVSVSAPVIHVNKDIWGEDATEFRPERWIEADAEYLKIMDRNFLAVWLRVFSLYARLFLR
jgi:cytochrome P450